MIFITAKLYLYKVFIFLFEISLFHTVGKTVYNYSKLLDFQC
jgi:hypothetical protein